jgi:tRNA(fMet)-specific endonuclease VapC
MRYMLDTDTCSWMIHRRPGYEGILDRCEGKRYGQIVVSAISFAEIQFMAANSVNAAAKFSRIVHLMMHFAIEPFEESAAQAYGRVRLALRRSPIGQMDTLIAAHATSVGATVVSGNERHFSLVPGLAVENWIRRTSAKS